jgi:hypothetical protein
VRMVLSPFIRSGCTADGVAPRASKTWALKAEETWNHGNSQCLFSESWAPVRETHAFCVQSTLVGLMRSIRDRICVGEMDWYR